MEQSLDSGHPIEHPGGWRLGRYQKGGGLLLALLLVGTFWFLRPKGENQVVPPASSETPRTTTAAPVSVESVVLVSTPRWLEVTGTVQAELETPIASKVMGRVMSLLAKEGDRVRLGQPLVLLEARDLDATLSAAHANVRVANAGAESAQVTARMEAALNTARVAEANARVAQTEAAIQAATAKLELLQAGPRRQEREQAALAVTQAQSNLALAESNWRRMANLYREGAISAQQHDQYQAQYEVAKSQVETAQQGKSLLDEGSRREEIRAAQQAVRQAQAATQEARASLKLAQASALQVKVRQREVQGAQAQVGLSQAGLQQAKVNRAEAQIFAPFEGVITKRLADPGTMASPGVPLLMLQGGALRLEAVVPESALASVRLGASLPISLDSLNGQTLTGRVGEIVPKGDANSHTFLVKIVLPTNRRVFTGQFGRARLPIGQEKRLLVPASAIFEREGLRYLYTVDANQTARLRMVTVGATTGDRIAVLSGLQPGERVVVTGREQVKDGSALSGEVK